MAEQLRGVGGFYAGLRAQRGGAGGHDALVLRPGGSARVAPDGGQLAGALARSPARSSHPPTVARFVVGSSFNRRVDKERNSAIV